MGPYELAELFLEDLDLKSFEIGQLEPALLFLDALADAGGVKSFDQLEVCDFLSY